MRCSTSRVQLVGDHHYGAEDIFCGGGGTQDEWADKIKEAIEQDKIRKAHYQQGYVFPCDQRVEVDMRTMTPVRVARYIDPEEKLLQEEMSEKKEYIWDYGYESSYKHKRFFDPSLFDSKLKTAEPSPTPVKPRDTKAFQRYQTEQDLKINVDRPRLVLQRSGRYKLELSNGRFRKNTVYRSRSNRPASQRLHEKRRAQVVKSGYIFPIDEPAVVDVRSFTPLSVYVAPSEPDFIFEFKMSKNKGSSGSGQLMDYQRELYEHLTEGSMLPYRPVTTTCLFNSVGRVAQNIQ